MHMSYVYAVNTCGCSLSVTCQVAMVNETLRAGSGSIDYTRTLNITIWWFGGYFCGCR